MIIMEKGLFLQPFFIIIMAVHSIEVFPLKKSKKQASSKKSLSKKKTQQPQNKKHRNNRVLKAKAIIAKNREALKKGSADVGVQQISKQKRILRIVRKSFFWTLFALLAAALITFVLIRVNGGTPTVFGYSLQRVSSGSMAPELQVGDIILSKEVKSVDDVSVGDIISYTGGEDLDNKTITHRLIKGPWEKADGAYYVITKGDANEYNDDEISFSDVRSKMTTKLGFLNKTYEFFLSPWGLLVFIAVLIMIYFDELLTFAKVVTGNYDPEENEEYREEIERERAEEEERRREEELRKYKRANWKKYDNTSKRKKKNRKKNKNHKNQKNDKSGHADRFFND